MKTILGIGVGLGKVRQGALMKPYDALVNLLNDGDSLFYDFTDLDTIIKNESNKLSRWNEKFGSGKDFIQINEAKQPIWTSEGIVFDNNSIKTLSFLMPQPNYIYLVIKHVSYIESAVTIDGNANYSGLLWQTSLNKTQILPSTPTMETDLLTVGDFKILRIFRDGINGKYKVNGRGAAFGDTGTGSMDGLTLGSRGDQLWNFANIAVKYLIVKSNLNNEDKIYNLLSKIEGIIDSNVIEGNVIISGDSLVANNSSDGNVSQHMTITSRLTDQSFGGDKLFDQWGKYINMDSAIKLAANYVFILAGINEFFEDGVTPEITLSRYQSFIDKIKIDSPNAKIIITKLLPCRGYSQAIYDFSLAVNAGLSSLTGIDHISTTPSYTMDDGSGYLKSEYASALGDGLHEGSAGKELIATDWYNISKTL